MKQRKPVSKNQLGLPYASGSVTSMAAAVSMASSAESYRQKVLEFVRAQGAHGATSDEVQSGLGLTHQNGSARVSELANRFKLIVDSGKTRPTKSGRKAVVYVTPENDIWEAGTSIRS